MGRWDYHGNPHHAGHHQLHGSVMQKRVHNGVGSVVHSLFFIGLSQLGALGVEHLAVLHDIEFAVVKHLAGGGALGRSNRIIDTRWCGYVLDQPTINILLLKSASSTARADANNDKFFIVIIDLIDKIKKRGNSEGAVATSRVTRAYSFFIL